MRPQERPQQRVNLVVELPPRPDVQFVVGYDVYPEQGMRKRPWPRSPHLLVNVEWAETPMNNGINGFYIEGRRRFWMLWNRWLDDNAWTPRWRWISAGYCPRKGVDRHTAGIHLLMAYLEMDGTAYSEDSDHWINETGLLSVEELRAIAHVMRAKLSA
jgi:hypothetical protein